MSIKKVLVYLLCLGLSALTVISAEVSEDEAYKIGIEAYHYFYPILLMDINKNLILNLTKNNTSNAEDMMNVFCSIRTFPDINFQNVLNANLDTLYSSAWLNLTSEPMIISVPDTNGRYYLLQIFDMWTDNFAVPGKRTSGTNATNFAIIQQGWNGSLPIGIEKIVSTTPFVWLLNRIQTNGVNDYSAVHILQDKFKITPLSQWETVNETRICNADSSILSSTSVNFVNSLSAEIFFRFHQNLIGLFRLVF